LTKASRSSVFSLDFFLSLAGLGCGEDDNDDSGADPSASSRDLFFPALAFELLDGDGFILQVQGVGVLDRKTYQGVPEVVDCAVGIVIG
jgi:hypothetical protein